MTEHELHALEQLRDRLVAGLQRAGSPMSAIAHAYGVDVGIEYLRKVRK